MACLTKRRKTLYIQTYIVFNIKKDFHIARGWLLFCFEMNRYHYRNKNSQTSVSASTTGKMPTRRQVDHESGYYEDVTDDCYGYSSNFNNTGKRQRQVSNEALNNVEKRHKRQVGGSSATAIKKKDVSSSSINLGMNNLTKKSRHQPANVYSNNVSTNGTMNKITTHHIQNLHCRKNNNNINNNINKEQKLKIAAGVNTKLCPIAPNFNDYSNINNNNNNNIYELQNEKRNSNDIVSNSTTININEIVEVPDSDSETDDKAAMSLVCKTNIKKSRNSSAFKEVPTYLVSGSSSNSNHSIPNYYDQKASGSNLNNKSASNKEAKQRDTAINGTETESNNANADLERLQREIEDVTQVHTNCKCCLIQN